MRRPRPALLWAVGWIGVSMTACGPSTRDIADARALYGVALDGFVVRQEPGPVRLAQDVDLDLAVRREASGESPGGLPGITADVDQVDAAGRSRRHWRIWIDTAGLAPGGERRTGQVLEDVDYAPGDGFRIEVRRSVPAAERAQYAEWGAATSGGPGP